MNAFDKTATQCLRLDFEFIYSDVIEDLHISNL